MPHRLLPPPTPLLLIISGPAGSGKTTLCDRLVAAFSPSLERVVTATSRSPRPHERNGEDYHFFSPEEFEKRIAAGDFYEHAYVHGRHYGVPRQEIHGTLDRGTNLILNVDVQGAATVRDAAKGDPDLRGRVVSIFVMPASMRDLKDRLKGRGTDDEAEIERRLNTAEEEIKRFSEYDYCILSGSRDTDFDRLRAIYLAEQLKLTPKG